MDPDYCLEQLPKEVLMQLEAGAFRSLCEHLADRPDVQNMDLMSLSGFCRNCLAKWMVLEARKMVDQDDRGNDVATKNALNQLGYDEAARHVYGMQYDEWKKRHQKKATDEQMVKYKESQPIHAVHDKDLLEKREAKEDTGKLSNVCCQDVEEVVQQKPKKSARALPPFVAPSLPSDLTKLSLGVLTISDRAFKKEYSTGDLSGPAVEDAIKQIYKNIDLDITNAIVPDEVSSIEDKLKSWAELGVDIILTTGGTGMSKRDVTPEATRNVIEQECQGLMTFVLAETSKIQPLASLSRGTAGIIGKTLVANLPGNPKAITEISPILLPLLAHAMRDM